MHQISSRRPQHDGTHQTKRWSTSLIEINNASPQTSTESQSPYSALLTNKLGIPKEKAERACVATGFRSLQAATNWLLQRHDIDKIVRSEFILLLCPDDILNQQIRKFNYELSQELFKNSSIKGRPHLRALKLSSFFHVPDQHVYTLHKIFDSVIDQYKKGDDRLTINLSLHASNDYLMLIPSSESRHKIQNLFQMIKTKFEQTVPNVPVIISKKIAHITLIHGVTTIFNFTVEQRSLIMQLVQMNIDLVRSIRWSLRLYSREQPVLPETVYRVISSALPTKPDNSLTLKANDLFMVIDNVSMGEHENVYGRSFSTGEEGQIPLKNLQKASETETWTLQKSVSIINDESNDVHNSNSEITKSLQTNESSSAISNGVRTLLKKSMTMTKTNVENSRPDPLSSTSNPGSIRLFCVRHGERVDFAFGPLWADLAFDKSGNYHRVNLNLPAVLPRRQNPLRDFLGDSPITEIGASQARLTGEALASNDCLAQYCYSSPALRCIQTAHYILQGMGLEDRVKIRIEPGLFEFLGWYERGLPAFFTRSDSDFYEDEIKKMFNIDKTYRPIIPLERLSRDEKYIDYYNRSFKVTQQITDKHKLTGANIFFIGHAATLEVCTRQLCSFQPRSYSDFNGVIRKVSYLALQLCERNPLDGQWTLRPPPIPPIQHSNNLSYDWESMK